MNLDDFDMVFSYLDGSTHRHTTWFDLTARDVGTTAYATADTHPEFSSLAALLTNGINEEFCPLLLWPEGNTGRVGTGMPFWESEIDKTVSSSPDFAGLDIGTIAFTLDQFNYQYPYDHPYIPEPAHHLNYAFTISFYSDIVPEPTTLLLLGLGGLLIRKRK